MEKYLNFINNQWVAADDGASISVSNPATEEMVGLVSAASAGQAVHACDVAAAAQRAWRKLTSIERGNHLHLKPARQPLVRRWRWSLAKASKTPRMRRSTRPR